MCSSFALVLVQVMESLTAFAGNSSVGQEISNERSHCHFGQEAFAIL